MDWEDVNSLGWMHFVIVSFR